MKTNYELFSLMYLYSEYFIIYMFVMKNDLWI
jgi:hypothetical protein